MKQAPLTYFRAQIRFILKYSYVLLALLLLLPALLSAQGFKTKFGKSKVQYESFDWYFYRTTNFEVYYHQGGKNLAQYVLTHADEYLDELQQKLDYRIGERISLVIYNTYSDYRQSNITLSDEFYNTGGLTPVVDNIGFVYFDGEHASFNNRIKRAIAEVIVNEAVYGSSVQQRIQNATLINIPDWYYNSFVKYISGDWSSHDKRKLEEGILQDDFKKFGRLSENDRIIIGYSLWEYIEKKYGKNVLANMLYMVRVNKNIESGFTYILGKDFKNVYAQWYKSTRYKYRSKIDENFDEISHIEEIKELNKKGEITSIKLGPKAQKIAWVNNYKGKSKIYVYDLDAQKRTRVYKKGPKKIDYFQDYIYPIIDWYPSGDKLLIGYEKKSRPYIATYDLEKKKMIDKRELERIDKMLSFDVDDFGRSIVMSAIWKGSSDIFIYQLRSRRLFPVTNDIYDDLEPHFVRKSAGVVFSSNRTSTYLQRKYQNPEEHFNPSFDIFMADIKNKSKKLTQISYTPWVNETKPAAFDSVYFSYLTDENSIINRNAAYTDSIFNRINLIVHYEDSTLFKADTFTSFKNDLSSIRVTFKTYNDTLLQWDESLSDSLGLSIDTIIQTYPAKVAAIDTQVVYNDTAYAIPLTNYASDILSYDIAARITTMSQLFYRDGSYVFSIFPTPYNIKNARIKRMPENEIYKLLDTPVNKEVIDDKDDNKPEKVAVDEEVKDTFPYYFLNDFDILRIDTSSKKNALADFIFFDQEYQTPDFVKKSLDRKRNRFGSSSMYFLSFTPDFLVSQIDNSYLENIYLPYNPNQPVSTFNKGANAFVMFGINDHFNDIKVNGGFRLQTNLDGVDFLLSVENLKKRLDKKLIYYRSGETSGDVYSKQKSTTDELRFRMAYPFNEYAALRVDLFGRQDLTTYLATEQQSLEKPDDLNTFVGSKIEFVYDNTIQLAQNLYSGTRGKVYFENYRHLNNFKSEFSVYGLDVRNYIKIHRELIWANRLAFASSIGNSKVAFFLGGVESWLFPKVNNEIQPDPDVNYIYKSLAVNMRGFSQNIRNGNSYAMINSEIRWPIIRYFSNHPVKSAFWDHFQVVGFADVGTAWNGFQPYSENNSLNKRIIEKNPFIIRVETVGEPIVAGYGLGIRSELFGYFIRLDHAWGIEGFKQFGEITYLSLGLDF